MATGSEDGRTAPQTIIEPSHRGAPNPPGAAAVSPPSKRELVSWWKKFGRKAEKDEEKVNQAPGIFGVPLSESIRYANVAISLTNEQGESFIYGYVPIVVAKCGVFLKEKATDVEGIFRLSGSAKRIKDLQAVFNSPDRYGKGLDWTGYTVHDAANILRRYLNQLPEPIVPLESYERFRDPLRAYQSRLDDDTPNGHTTEFTAAEHSNAVVAYQKLITELPALNRQLLLYILDLLAVFASKSDLNRMNAGNLAAIFQPGIISHPVHDMAPQEYRLSQDVLIFLIENQDNFLIGMTGTAVDAQTQKDVESGAPSVRSPKPNIGRSASNASAGADSLRKFGLRRNVSTSSRSSRDRTSPNVSSPGTPSTPTYAAGVSGGSIGRSNTVPSKRSPAIGQHRFQRPADSSIQNSPVATPIAEPAALVVPQSERKISGSEARAASGEQRRTPSGAAVTLQDVPPVAQSVPQPQGEPGPTLPGAQTPTGQQARSRERKISNIFSKSPIFGPSQVQASQQERQPRKLQKRQRLPGSMNESAQSSAASLQNEDGFHTPLMSPGLGSVSHVDPLATANPASIRSEITPTTEFPPDQKYQTPPFSHEKQTANSGLKPPRSPTTSLHSRGSVTDPSDFDALEDPIAKQEKRRNRWRFSSSAKRPADLPLGLPPPIGQNPGARTSNSSIGSSNRPRQSFSLEPQTSYPPIADSSSTGQQSLIGQSSLESTELSKEMAAEAEKKGLFGKWKAKMQQSREDRREKEAEKERAKSPQRMTGDNVSSRNSLSAFAQEHLATAKKSVDKSGEDGLPAAMGQSKAEPPAAMGQKNMPQQLATVQQSVPHTSSGQPQSVPDSMTEPQPAVSHPEDIKSSPPQTMAVITEERPATEQKVSLEEADR